MSIAFPSISTGVYGFPIERAALLPETVRSFVTNEPFDEVRFVPFSREDYGVYRQALEALAAG